jgi:hypothetical protein
MKNTLTPQLPEVATTQSPNVVLPKDCAGVVEKIVQRKIQTAQQEKKEKKRSKLEIKKHKRNLELLSKPLLSFSIRLETGRGLSMKFSFRHLGLTEAHIKKIREKKLNEPTMAVFEELKQAHGRLAYGRKRILAMMQDMEGQTVCSEEDWLNKVKPALTEYEEEVEKEKRWVLSQYVPGLRSFLLSVYDILKEIELSPEEVESALDLYAAKFPSAEEIADRLQLVVIGPIRIPSLAEQARHNAELQEAENRLLQVHLERQALSLDERMLTEAEYARRRLIQEEEVAVKRAISENLNRIAKNFDSTLEWVKEEILTAVADQLTDIEQKADEGKVGYAAKQRLERLLDKIDELLRFVPGGERDGLRLLADRTAQLSKHFTKTRDKTQIDLASKDIKTKIARIRKDFNNEFSLICLGEEDEGYWGERMQGVDL